MILKNVKEIEITIFSGIVRGERGLQHPCYTTRKFQNAKEVIVSPEWIKVELEDKIYLYNKKPIMEIVIKK